MKNSLVLELAKHRKTVRTFSKSSVDLKEVLLALEAACQAPSGGNSQPWRFVIVKDPKSNKRIREKCGKAEKEFNFKGKEGVPSYQQPLFLEK